MSKVLNDLLNAIANNQKDTITLFNMHKSEIAINKNMHVIAKAAIDFNNTQLLKIILTEFPIKNWEWLFTYQTPAGTTTLSYCEIHGLSDEIYNLLKTNGAMLIHARLAG
ncbi:MULTISPECIES: hypothetical protein [Legionella]|uniref:hypothetical protein n=1 Tax=Legionella TaxID=445 RepID=UPI00095ECF6B|nr:MULTISPECIES: hypothetical protein [Legionella]MBN9228584.1 hypothetical protein [Legionella steelei]OJW08093.1 MAG: hypothetical protein BGO44_12405 [Legionella sp. 39-23]